jgi:hypothetical protein
MDRGATNEAARLAELLAMPDLAPVAEGRRVELAPNLPLSFVADAGERKLRLGPAAFAASPGPRITLRHGLELLLQMELCPDPVLSGLVAARAAALFALLEVNADKLHDCGWWYGTLAGVATPGISDLEAIWSVIAAHQPGAPSKVSDETAFQLRAMWRLIGPAEYLMGTGGDVRLKLDPDTGLNQYGCSSRPRPWAVTFASSTASSISERGYAGAERARRDLLRDAFDNDVVGSQRALAAGIRDALMRFYRLPSTARIVLTPSGTDGEICALALASLAAPARPLTNILLASEETGTGVPLAATGRHFGTLTARDRQVEKGALIEGFPRDVELMTVRARSEDGCSRSKGQVDAECADKLASAIARDRRVLFHVMDQSKTGLRLSDSDSIGLEQAGVDVVVDACQGRLAAEAIAGYLERNFMVLVTGSKFFTGPPFAGALILPRGLAARLEDEGARLPPGLADYFGHLDWPSLGRAGAVLAEGGNVGLMLRWSAALAEMEAFGAVAPAEARRTLIHFGQRVGEAIRSSPDLFVHETPSPGRSARSASWDSVPTIFTFSVWRKTTGEGTRRLLDLVAARQVYWWLNSDLSACLSSGVTDQERALARRQFHIGQPIAMSSRFGNPSGALRLSAGARLVSGEPSQAAADPVFRLEREIDDAIAALSKISLIMRHYETICSDDPRPHYRPHREN